MYAAPSFSMSQCLHFFFHAELFRLTPIIIFQQPPVWLPLLLGWHVLPNVWALFTALKRGRCTSFLVICFLSLSLSLSLSLIFFFFFLFFFFLSPFAFHLSSYLIPFQYMNREKPPLCSQLSLYLNVRTGTTVSLLWWPGLDRSVLFVYVIAPEYVPVPCLYPVLMPLYYA